MFDADRHINSILIADLEVLLQKGIELGQQVSYDRNDKAENKPQQSILRYVQTLYPLKGLTIDKMLEKEHLSVLHKVFSYISECDDVEVGCHMVKYLVTCKAYAILRDYLPKVWS
jgi:hypothetical protein